LKSAKILNAASSISAVLASEKSKVEFDSKLSQIKDNLGLPLTNLHELISNISKTFQEQCGSLDIELPSLPQYLETYSVNAKNPDSLDNNISGEFDFMLKVVAENMDDYYNFHVNKLSEADNIGHVQSVFVMGIIKQTHVLVY
jgi:DNA-binding Lrp family transcriptional regulator